MGQVNSFGTAARGVTLSGALVWCAAVAAVGGAGAESARADLGVLGHYQDLVATFDASTGRLEIYAADLPTFQSAGYVREMGGPRSAVFSAGFVSEPNPASFSASLMVTNIGEGSAEVSGDVTVTDVDGDTITMGVSHYSLQFGQADGSVAGTTTWLDVSSDEALFDGTDGGQVGTNFPLDSAMISLFIRRDPRDGMGLFHASFDDGRASALFAIPSPGGAVVGLLAAASCSRRRRAV